jgi:hypothetical protein
VVETRDEVALGQAPHAALRFARVALAGAVHPAGGGSARPNGFPRHGDGFNIDVGEPDAIPVDPSGPVTRNALPGGEIWDNQSPHFRDEAELWRRNENHPLPFVHDDD